MKLKSWTKYFICISLILIMVFLGHHVSEIIRENAQKTLNFNPYYTNVIMIIFYGSIGLLLGLEHFISELKKKGKWMLILPKIIIMGLPSLYFSFFIFIYYNNNHIIHNFIAYPISLLIEGGSNFIPVFQITLGYSIITSFYKDNKFRSKTPQPTQLADDKIKSRK